MGLDFAIDELYSTGWAELNSAGCSYHGGRAYPGLDLVRKTFADEGLDLSIRHIQLFDCHRAEWRDATGKVQGAVVGQTELEAGVFAMSQLRRQMMAMA